MSNLKDSMGGETSIADLMAPVSQPELPLQENAPFQPPAMPQQAPKNYERDQAIYERAQESGNKMPNQVWSPQNGTTTAFDTNAPPVAYYQEPFRGLRVLQNTPPKDILLLAVLFFALQQATFKDWLSGILPVALKGDSSTTSIVIAVLCALVYFLTGAYI